MSNPLENAFEGLDLTGWERKEWWGVEGPEMTWRRELKTLPMLWLRSSGVLVIDEIVEDYCIECTDLPAAIELANAIAKATGGWENG